MTPQGQNASAMYQKVLIIDPRNAEALAGLAKIAAVYEKAARSMFDQDYLAIGWEIIERGLSIAPNNPGLLELSGQLQSL